MRKFRHFNARSLEEAALVLGRYNGKANVIAGGTDLLGKMKDEILPAYPEALVNIKSIAGLDDIVEKKGALMLGALTRLEDIAKHPVIRKRYVALGEAAARTASPHIREMGTIGGNLCQDVRCWYYRNPNNRFPCLRKGGGRCYALEGDNRYHSIFGGSVDQGCYAVHPSDTAPAVIALNGRIKTSRRTLKGEDFFEVGVTKTTVLEPDEIVTGIEIPTPAKETRSVFMKFAVRKTIDFPIVNCAVMIGYDGGKVNAARICLNAVYVTPRRAKEAEAAILGREINAENAESAANAAVGNVKPLKYNGYMVQITRALVKRGLMACQQDPI